VSAWAEGSGRTRAARRSSLPVRPVIGGALATAYLSLVVLVPLAAVVAESTTGGASAFWDAITASQAVAAMRFTVLCSLAVVAINVVTGTLIAWVLVRDEFPGKRAVNALIDLPFALPTIVAGLTLLALYGPKGPAPVDIGFTRAAVILALLFVTLPFVVRSVQPVLIELDREMEEAAASLGARPRTIFRRIVLPNLVPAIASGAGLAFARALGEFGSVVLISGNIPFKTEVASVYLFGQIESDNRPAAAAVSVVLLVLSFVLLLGVSWISTRDIAVRSRLALRFAALGYLAALLVLPVGMVFYRTFEHGLGPAWDAVTTPDAQHAFWLTCTMVAIAVPLNTIFGVGLALALVRGRWRGKMIVSAIVDLPFAVSPVVVGLALILVYGKAGWLGGWLADNGVRVIFSTPGMALATIFVSLPFVVREVVPVLREIGIEQEDAARTLGASPAQAFWRITLPAIRWGVAYGVILTTARALGEFGAVAVVSGKLAGQTETLTLHVEQRFEAFDLTGAYAASVVLALIALAVIGSMTLLDRRKES